MPAISTSIFTAVTKELLSDAATLSPTSFLDLDVQLGAVTAAVDPAKYITLTIVKAYTTYTTTILLGNDAATPTPVATVVGPNTIFEVPITTTASITSTNPASTFTPLTAAPASSDTSNGVLIGAILGSILGGIFLLFLLYLCYAYRPVVYDLSSSSSGSSSDSSSESSIQVTRPRRFTARRVELRETGSRATRPWWTPPP
jgi:hypothetical protein